MIEIFWVVKDESLLDAMEFPEGWRLVHLDFRRETIRVGYKRLWSSKKDAIDELRVNSVATSR